MTVNFDMVRTTKADKELKTKDVHEVSFEYSEKGIKEGGNEGIILTIYLKITADPSVVSKYQQLFDLGKGQSIGIVLGDSTQTTLE